VATFELEHDAGRDSKVTLVLLTGELDRTNVDNLDDRLAAIGDALPLVLDLSRLLFVDSAALQRLFRIARERGPRGVAFVVEPSAPVAATLAIVELGRAAPIVWTRDEAVAAVGRGNGR
jgi:anti-anti-sigma factor